MRPWKIATEQVIHTCRGIANFTEAEPYITRTFLSRAMAGAYESLADWMGRAGLQVRVDAAGNLRGWYPGEGPRRLLIGSHLDTVQNAGAFDGVLGVVMAVKLVQMLNGRRLPFGIEVLGFSEEEGVRFGVPFIGSRALVGTLDQELLSKCDRKGISVAAAIRSFGLDPAKLPEAVLGDDVLGYFEFHIEQGPVLERRRLPVGVVQAIAGQTRASVTFTGQAGHAGTTPMRMRRDALAAASEWVLAVEREAGECVATVGELDLLAPASNVICGHARASLDVRHANDKIRRATVKRMAARARQIARRRGVVMDWQDRLDQAAVPMDRTMTAVLEGAVKAAGIRVHRMISGAGHDAMILAKKVPVAMLFVRSPGGISHHPDETVLPEDVAAALEIGERFLQALS